MNNKLFINYECPNCKANNEVNLLELFKRSEPIKNLYENNFETKIENTYSYKCWYCNYIVIIEDNRPTPVTRK